jgi:hypothetical protein
VFALLELTNDREDMVRNYVYNALKKVAGNLRYAEVSK